MRRAYFSRGARFFFYKIARTRVNLKTKKHTSDYLLFDLAYIPAKKKFSKVFSGEKKFLKFFDELIQVISLDSKASSDNPSIQLTVFDCLPQSLP